MPFGIGATELIIILVVALLVFGPKRLPEMGRSLGSGLREFRDSITGRDEPAERAIASQPTTSPENADHTAEATH